MRLLARRSSGRRGGFSLIETMVASVIFMAVGYVLVVSVDMGSRSQTLVLNSADENDAVRTAASTLVEELQTSTDDQITVTKLLDGNSQVTLMVPINVGGDLTWGTEPDDVSYDEQVELEPNEGWLYCYTVEAYGKRKRLIRQVLDDQLVLQSEETLVLDLDTEDEPCFDVSKVGDMWVVSIATKDKTKTLGGETYVSAGRRSEFHVRTRN